MNAPFDPEETHDGSEREDDPFGENSLTWGGAEPDFDRMLRDRIGEPTTLPTPPYAFERVLLAGRRRRARKVWAAGAAAAIVVMVGTAGTTVALRGNPSGGVVGPAASGTQRTTTQAAKPSPSASPSSTPKAVVTEPAAVGSSPTQAGSGASPSSAATVAQCHSDDLQLTVSVKSGSASGTGSVLIVLRNNSAHTCTTHGYPGLQTETENEQLQTTTVTRIDRSAVATLTVGAGQSISTVATFTTPASGATATPGAGCGAPSYYLAVIPPNEQNQIAATIEGGPVTVCGNGELKTSPLVMGQSG
ncbi:MAG TPA: DUF4232 domain-containing protein [Actinospica sp.]|nr:DUF4232 domain-containing protein [Actinospica sp.]